MNQLLPYLPFLAPIALVAVLHLLVHLLVLVKLPKGAAFVARYTPTITALLPAIEDQVTSGPSLVVLARDLDAASKARPDDPVLVVLAARAKQIAGTLTVVALAIVMVGCADVVTTSVRVVNASHDSIVSTHDAMESTERDELTQAVKAATDEAAAKASVDAVEKHWATAWARYTDVRLAWIAARVSVAAAQTMSADAGWQPDKLGLLSKLAVLAQAFTALGEQIASDVKKGGK